MSTFSLEPAEIPLVWNDEHVLRPLLAPDVFQALEASKSEIDAFTRNEPERLQYYSQCTNVWDPFAKLKKKWTNATSAHVTNAYLKCWEMLHEFDILPREPRSERSREPRSVRVFFNAELPGAFIFAFIDWCQRYHIHLDWNANSLWQQHGALGDQFGWYARFPERWLMNAECSGDVTDPAVWKRMESVEPVDVYTSDIGIGAWIQQELKECKLNVAQVLCGLLVLKPGGTMITKQFMWFTPLQSSLLHVLSACFEHVFLHKPITSKVANSEVYVIGMGFRMDQRQHVVERIKEWLLTFDESTTPFMPLCDVPDSAEQRLVHIATVLYSRQTKYVNWNCELVQFCEKNGLHWSHIEAHPHFYDRMRDVQDHQRAFDQKLL